MVDRSTDSDAVDAGARLNFMRSIAVLAELESAITSPRRLKVDDVSCRPPRAASLLFSELKSPVFSTAKAKTAATTTKAMRTMAVSRPVIPLWFCKNVSVLIIGLFFHSVMEFSPSAGRLPGQHHRSAIIS